jgi:hypothetical protein
MTYPTAPGIPPSPEVVIHAEHVSRRELRMRLAGLGAAVLLVGGFWTLVFLETRPLLRWLVGWVASS